MSTDASNQYVCLCNKRFASEDQLREHIRETIDATDWKIHGIRKLPKTRARLR